MERKSTRRRRNLKKRLIIAGVALAVIGAGVAFGLAIYPRIVRERVLRRADAAVQAKEYRVAAINLKRALSLNDRDVVAVRKMAELAESIGSGEALYWRRRLVELEPANEGNQSALIELALRSRNAIAMNDAVNKWLALAPNNAVAHHYAARVAIANNDSAVAIKELETASKLNPQNESYRYELAELQLASGTAEEKDASRKVVEAALAKPDLARRATKALVEDALRRSDVQGAIAYSSNFLKQSGVTFEDQIYHLALLRRTNSAAYAGFLTDVQTAAASKPEEAAPLMSWLIANGSALVALEWSKRLSPEVVSAMPVPLALSEAYATLGDWAGLKSVIDDPEVSGDAAIDETGGARKNWGQYEFMRAALKAWTLRKQAREGEFRVQWTEAIRLAERRPASLNLLANAGDHWGWKKEAQDILWVLAQDPQFAKSALKMLNGQYYQDKNTRGLQRVAARMVELDPSDLTSKNNLASFALLLDDPKTGMAIAEELHRAQPENAEYASTYAFALHLHGRTDEAVRLMRSLGDERLNQPAYAAYFGVMLASAGMREDARKYLDISDKGTLLPEEHKLVSTARERLQ